MKLVLTGGPCAGKTTSLSYLCKKLEKKGYKVFFVPEAASLYLGNGFGFYGMTEYEQIQFQTYLMRTQIMLEDSFETMVKTSNQKYVIICDRGLLDGKAFTKKEFWEIILSENSWNETNFLNRYDAVIHLVTAAKGAKEHYEKTRARQESEEEAIRVDSNLITAWTGHDKLKIIDNFSTFENKLKRVKQTVFQLIGEPTPNEIERKFKVSKYNLESVQTKTFNIEQYYLKSSDQEEKRIRRKISLDDNISMYTYTEKSISYDGKRLEQERKIGGREFFTLKKDAERIVKKQRTSFIWNDINYELDVFDSGLIMLEIELDSLDQKITIPDFIEIEKEVTSDKNFYNKNLSIPYVP